MIKINENEAIITREDLFVLIGAAGVCEVIEDDEFMKVTEHLYGILAKHIWEGQRIPEAYINYVKDLITPEKVRKKEIEMESEEGMRSICRLLLAALQKTREYQHLTDILYDPDFGTIVKYADGRSIMIHTEGDSGSTMIKDILAHL